MDFSNIGDSLKNLQSAVKEGDTKILANQKAQALYKKAISLDKGIMDTLHINKGEKASAFGKWLVKIGDKSPWLGRQITGIRNGLFNLKNGFFFNPHASLMTGELGKGVMVKNSSIGAKISNGLARLGSVGKSFGKALRNPLKGPVFITALIDGVMSIGTAIKDVVQVTKKDGILAGLWAGTKSLAKSAVGIGTGLLAVGATAALIGTGPIGLVVGTVAYIAGSYLGNKVVGAVLPAQDKPEPKGARPFAHVTPYPYQGPGLDLTVDEILELGPEGLSEHLQARVDEVNRRKFTR